MYNLLSRTFPSPTLVGLHDTQELNDSKEHSTAKTQAETQQRELDRLVEAAEFNDSIAEAKRASEVGTFDGLRFVNQSLSNRC